MEYHNFKNSGWPKLIISRHGVLKIGYNFRSNNRVWANPVGAAHQCTFLIGNGAELIIGNNVGISSTTICCMNRITIGDHVNIGGGVEIYDTDFHSLCHKNRASIVNDTKNAKTKPVKINNHVFIGSRSIILKGVTIGEGAIVGAGSIVTGDIPDWEIWSGNPAKKIRDISDQKI